MSVRLDATGEYLKRTTGLIGAGDFTVLFWARLLTDPLPAGIRSLFKISTDPPNGAGYKNLYLGTYTPGTDDIGLQLFDSVTLAYAEIVNLPHTLPKLRWVHWAITRSGSLFTLYRDGQLVGTATLAITLSSGGIFFGSDVTSENGFELERYREWTMALTQLEVQAERASATPVKSGVFTNTALAVHTTLTDDSGNGHDWTGFGTLSTGDATQTAFTSATRFYLARKAPNFYLHNWQGAFERDTNDAPDTTDDHRITDDFYNFLLSPDKDQSTPVVFSSSVGVSPFLFTFGKDLGDDFDLLLLRWTTDPLIGGTLSGTLNVALGVKQNFSGPPTNAECYFHLHAYLTVGNSDIVRGVALDNYVDPAGASEFPTTATFKALNAAQALAGVVYQTGDRLVLEIGIRARNNLVTNTDNTAVTLYTGATDSSNVPLPDATVGGTDVTAKAGYIGFSAPLLLAPPSAAPVHDACESAKVIAVLPYTDFDVDVTHWSSFSGDPTISGSKRNGVWYSFTPDYTGRVLFAAFGSNVSINIAAYTGACGSLSSQLAAVRGNTDFAFQRSSVFALLAVTSGTTYRVHVHAAPAQGSPAGGMLRFAAYKFASSVSGDVFVGDHLLVVLDGATGVIKNALYAGVNTPTDSTFDLFDQPMVDIDTSTTTVIDRVFFTAFGLDYMEIYDLDLDAERNFMDVEAEFGGDGIAAESHIFDLARNFYVGYHGDTFTFRGDPPVDVNTARIRKWTVPLDPSAIAFDPYPANAVNQVASYGAAREKTGTEFIDLANDQKTIVYTSGGRRILRFDTLANLQLTDFVTVTATPGLYPQPRGLRSLRILTDGGVLVADGETVKRLNSAGSVILTYTPPTTGTGVESHELYVLEVAPDGASFWVGDQLNTRVYHFDLVTGALLHNVWVNARPRFLCGLGILGGVRVSVLPPLPPGGNGGPPPGGGGPNPPPLDHGCPVP